MGDWELEFGADAPQSVGSLVGEVVDGRMAARLSANQRAAAAWYRANGDRERDHTTGVFLKRSRVPGAAPILGVYVDSHIVATDFGVNKDIYLARLANAGCAVSGIEFIPSREGYRTRARARHTDQAAPEPLPVLTPAERAEVADLVADLPEGVRESAYKAVELSKRRAKLQKAHSDETR